MIKKVSHVINDKIFHEEINFLSPSLDFYIYGNYDHTHWAGTLRKPDNLIYMKKYSLIALLFLMSMSPKAQSHESTLERNKAFTGAEAKGKQYRAIFQLDSNDPKTIEKTFRNLKNALKDPRLSGKLEIELIAFSGGTDAYLKGGKYETDLKELAEKGVIIAQCNNTLIERNISRDDIYDFIGIVPSGTGEIIIREAQGWSIVKP